MLRPGEREAEELCPLLAAGGNCSKLLPQQSPPIYLLFSSMTSFISSSDR